MKLLLRIDCFRHLSVASLTLFPFSIFSLGFTLVFSALFSKTWRINRIFKAGTTSSRSKVKVSERDVLVPFVVLMSINVTILLCWTFIDPLTYHREADFARDEWNRVISTYGSCRSENSAYFLAPLLVVNFCVLLLANWQAYEARHIEAEFSESKYITICMASMLQAMVSGVPVLFFVRDMPQAYYMVSVLLSFIIGMVILMVIFVPKIVFTHQYIQMTPEQQKEYMANAIGKSTQATKAAAAGGGNRGSTTKSQMGMSTISDTSDLIIVNRAAKNRNSLALPEQARTGTNGLATISDEPYKEVSDVEENAKTVKFEKPTDVLKDNRETLDWGGMTLTQYVPTNPDEAPLEAHEDEPQVTPKTASAISEGDEDSDDEDADEDQTTPMQKFDRPVDVLNNKETTGWGGMTLSEIVP